MNFGKFIRKYSTDTENENSTNRTSIISGTTKLFDSVNTRTTNLVSGLSNTFEQIKRRTSVESLSFTDKEQTKLEESDNKSKSISQTNSKSSGFENIEDKSSFQDVKCYTDQSDIQNNYSDRNVNKSLLAINKKNPPPKPPPPLTKQISNPNEEERILNREIFSRSQTVSDRNYVEEVYNNEYFKDERNQNTNEFHEEAKSHLELECQKIVTAMDDLISFDPINNLSPVNVERNSSPSEYGETGDKPVYADKPILDRPTSSISVNSVSDEINEQQKDFMDFFVSDIYGNGNAQNDEISQNNFSKCIQTQAGRHWFVKLVEKYQYLNSKEVPEALFYRLLQIFTVVLLECYEHDDFLPARDLMLVAFGCYTALKTVNNHTMYNFYLSSFISCHPIWKSLQFWNTCFFNTVQEVRSKRSTRRNSANISDADGVGFHQLQVHLNYMRSLGLPVELCSAFVTKQVDIVNVTDDEMRRLNEVMESWKE